jgi:4a-hydroxytetrahydrobiopterin dehydratase
VKKAKLLQQARKSKGKTSAQKSDTPLAGLALEGRCRGLGAGWRVVARHHLERDFNFKNFREALAFTNRVGELAEARNHHPDIYLAWGKVRLTLWTHSVGGLSDNDFAFATLVDKLPLKP